MYLTIEIKGVSTLFIVCPSCQSVLQITGKKKPQKVRECWNCGHVYVESP